MTDNICLTSLIAPPKRRSTKDFQIIPTDIGTLTLGPLVSWEVVTGRPRGETPDGEERFSVMERSNWTLKWHEGHFSFSVPFRPTSFPLPVPYISRTTDSVCHNHWVPYNGSKFIQFQSNSACIPTSQVCHCLLYLENERDVLYRKWSDRSQERELLQLSSNWTLRGWVTGTASALK